MYLLSPNSTDKTPNKIKQYYILCLNIEIKLYFAPPKKVGKSIANEQMKVYGLFLSYGCIDIEKVISPVNVKGAGNSGQM